MRGIVLGGMAAAALALGACAPWSCDFDSHGACIEFATNPPDLAEASRRVDALLDAELPFWGLSNLDGWRVQFRDGPEYTCYLARRNEAARTTSRRPCRCGSRRTRLTASRRRSCSTSSGITRLGDPMHSAPRWQDVDDQFAPIVWDHPDAPPACVERYRGIHDGVWTVREDQF